MNLKEREQEKQKHNNLARLLNLEEENQKLQEQIKILKTNLMEE